MDNELEVDMLNELSMNIILHAGDARRQVTEALIALEDLNYEQATALLLEAEKNVVKAHGLQTSTLQKEAEGDQIRYSTLFSHAQDTLMNVQSELLLTKHLVKIFKKNL